MKLTTVQSWTSFDGTLSVHDHESTVCRGPMRFAVFTPPQAKQSPVPVLWYLSGLTCNWSNVMEKSGLQRVAAELGLMVVAPDTSPRGEDVPDDDGYDLGQGAGFYLTATEEPWAKHFRMDRYITEELQGIVCEKFPADRKRQAITGHSMGGHGALTLHLKHPSLYQSVSAFSPIVAPSQVPWGEKAFTAYLGSDRALWERYDATDLVNAVPSSADILIDQGEDDNFLAEQLRTSLFAEACEEAGQSVTIRMQPGYDHSYYFIASFMDDHLRHHHRVLSSLV